MSRLLFAIAFCMGMQAATAAASALPGSPVAAATAVAAAGGVMQATLSLGEKEAKGTQGGNQSPAVKSSLKADDAKEDGGETRHPTTGVMLLAALALMTGIALRRSGDGQQ